MPSTDAAEFLAGSPGRWRLLTRLADDPAAPAALAEATDRPRRSVQRHLGAFVDRGWAEKADGAYRLTPTGHLVVAEHAAYLDALDRVETFAPFLRHLPDRDHAPEPGWLESASVTAATPENPQAPIQRYVERVRAFDADEVRMLSPVLSRPFHEAHAELALDGVHTELVMPAETVERARELNPAEFAAVVGSGVVDLYRHPDDVGVGLTLGSDELIAGAYDDDGQLRACVESTDTDLRRWGERLFERYRSRSERVDRTGALRE